MTLVGAILGLVTAGLFKSSTCAVAALPIKWLPAVIAFDIAVIVLAGLAAYSALRRDWPDGARQRGGARGALTPGMAMAAPIDPACAVMLQMASGPSAPPAAEAGGGPNPAGYGRSQPAPAR